MYRGRTVLASRLACIGYIYKFDQVCTSGNNKLQGPENKPFNQLGKLSLVEMLQYSVFAMTSCTETMISKRNGIQF